MSWSYFRFAQAKGHFVRENLRAQLLEEATERKFGFEAEDRDVTEGGIDLPGMIWVHRGFEVIELPGGLKFSLPYSDAIFFMKELENAPLRSFKDGTVYYKLHGWLSCIIMNPFERDYLLAHLKLNEERIKAKDAEELQHIRNGTKPA